MTAVSPKTVLEQRMEWQKPKVGGPIWIKFLLPEIREKGNEEMVDI